MASRTRETNMDKGIVTAGDSKYFPGIIALINSIRKYHDYPITVLDGGLTRQQVDALELANIPVIKPENIVDLEHPRYSCSNIIFEIDRAGYDQILFLDSDIILLNNISEIFEFIKEYKYVGVKDCSDGLYEGRDPKDWLPLEKGGTNFFMGDHDMMNSGVVGIDRELYRNKLKPHIYKYKEEVKTYQMHDQELLRNISNDANIEYEKIDWKYNAIYLRSLRQSLKNLKEIGVKVLHFAGSLKNKPWLPEWRGAEEGVEELWKEYYNGGKVNG